MKSIHTVASSYINIGERSQQLDMVQHVQEFSTMVVLVTGAAGIGKTAFVNEAVSHLSVHHQVLSLNALNTLSENNLLEQVALHLGCASSFDEIDASLADMSEQNESLHLVIDDAHLLDGEALNLLVSKSQQDKGWHLVLCGDEGLQGRLNDLQEELQKDNTYHLIELGSLNELESGLFVDELLQVAGKGSTLLSEKKKHQLWLLSEGSPGKLIELVDVEKESTQLSSSKFPVGHVAAILLIGVALVFSYAYQDPVVVVTEEDVIAQLLAQKSPDEKVGSDTEPYKSDSAQVVNDNNDSPINENKPAKDNVVQSVVKQRVAVNELINDKAVASKIAPVTEKISKPAPKEIAKAVSSKASPKIHPLLRAQPQEYALQLLGVRNKKSAQDFIKRFSRQLNSEKLNVYETTFKGQPWFVVVYGPYQNKSNASDEAVSLSRSLKSQPWVRPISKIQEDIRKISP